MEVGSNHVRVLFSGNTPLLKREFTRVRNIQVNVVKNHSDETIVKWNHFIRNHTVRYSMEELNFGEERMWLFPKLLLGSGLSSLL